MAQLALAWLMVGQHIGEPWVVWTINGLFGGGWAVAAFLFRRASWNAASGGGKPVG